MRVVVADDSVLLREGLVLLREGLVRVVDEAGFTVVGSYGNAIGLLVQLETLDPAVAILDVRMPPTFRYEGAPRLPRAACGRISASCCGRSTSRSPARRSCCRRDKVASATC